MCGGLPLYSIFSLCSGFLWPFFLLPCPFTGLKRTVLPVIAGTKLNYGFTYEDQLVMPPVHAAFMAPKHWGQAEN